MNRHLRSLEREPYAYQREGVRRFLERGRLLLADVMGPGKTAQAVAACHVLVGAGRVQRALVVEPASLIELGDAWPSEAARRRSAGGIRTLRVRDGEVSYDLGVTRAEDGATDMILIDGEMSRVPAADYALLQLERLA